MNDQDSADESQLSKLEQDKSDYQEDPQRIKPHSTEAEIYAAFSASSGPLPPPHILKAYGLIQPGLDAKIVEMALNQAKHRQALEKAVILGDGGRAWAGLISAFILSMTAIGGGIYLIDRGREVSGAVLGTGAIASLVSVFIYGTNRRRQEREFKQEQLLEAMSEHSEN